MLNGETTEVRGRPRSLSIHPGVGRARSRTPSVNPLTAPLPHHEREPSSVHSDPSTSTRKTRDHQSSHGRPRSAGPPNRRRPRRNRFVGLGSDSLMSRIMLTMMSMNTRLLRKAEESKALAALANKPVDTENFLKHVCLRRQYPVLLKVEFKMASKPDGQHASRHGLKEVNAEKNQNPRSIPYDYNRVVLDPLPDEPDSDYVNASYVDSLINPKAYIVAQGPNENTVGDFWRMVWQERINFIVMLTKTFDFIKVMCVQYWPAAIGKEEEYGGVGVTVLTEEQIANFMIRTVTLRKGEDERTMYQFHYTEWPSHSCPFSNALLEFRRRVRIYMRKYPPDGPVLVHCSDGAGRSGVFVSIDSNLEQAEDDGMFNVYGCLKKIRAARKGLVETIEQYKFVYETLEEYIMCGSTWFPVSELSDRLKFKSTKNPRTKMSEYQREFNQMNKMAPKFSIGDCAGGHRPENRDKNRDVITVPPDNFRPYLSSFQGNTCTDYINAVFVDGYIRPREYIVTEWPVSHTIADLWSLVYDHECNTVVVLCNPSSKLPQYPQFWPDSNKVRKYGSVFSVERVQQHDYNNIKSWIFRINKKVVAPHRKSIGVYANAKKFLRGHHHDEEQQIVALTELMAGIKAETKTCQLFQLTCWPIGNMVPTSTNSLVELMNMVEHWRQRTDYGPVVVVSLDGRARAGVYCAANACIEQVVQHEEVDVFQAVKTVRRHRPQLVENITEYKYCYDLVLHYVLHYLHKK